MSDLVTQNLVHRLTRLADQLVLNSVPTIDVRNAAVAMHVAAAAIQQVLDEEKANA